LGLTSQAARDIQHFGNTQQEQLSLRGKARGDKARGKGKGLLWGNP
jgi:hypothetical protein